MILYLDTTERDSFRVAIIDKGMVVKDKTIASVRAHSEKLLKTVNSLLVQSKKSIKDIVGIAVVVGPGSFTSLRVGIATANALSYALAIPVVGVEADWDLKQAGHLFKNNKLKIVLPKYGQPPHITRRGGHGNNSRLSRR